MVVNAVKSSLLHGPERLHSICMRLLVHILAYTMIECNVIAREYGWPQSLDHGMGKIRCIQMDAAGSDQCTKCSSAGVR